MRLSKSNISKFYLALVLVSLAVFVAARGLGAQPGASSEAGLKRASAAEIRDLQATVKVEILRTNKDSLGNTRLVAKIENTSQKVIPLLEVSFRDGAAPKNGSVVAQTQVGQLAPNEPVTFSAATATAADEVVVRDLEREISALWLEL